MITDIDITNFQILSPLKEDQVKYIQNLQNKRPRISNKFPTQITVSQDIRVKGSLVKYDNTFYISNATYKLLPILWKSKKELYKDINYLFKYSSAEFDDGWESFCQNLYEKVYSDCIKKSFETPEVDFAKKMCRSFKCMNGINTLAISDKGFHLCKYSDEIVQGNITEIGEKIALAKENIKSYCTNCICYKHCNMKCGIAKKNMHVCEAMQTLYTYMYQLEEDIFAYLYIDFPIKNMYTEGREFFELKDLSVETISTYADKDIIPCLKLSSNDLDKMLSEDNRLYLDMRVLDKLEFWLPCTYEDVYKYNKLLKKLKYIKPFNLYPEKEDDYEIIRFYMNKQINFSLFSKQKYTNIYEFWQP